jgi:hypothetical protein
MVTTSVFFHVSCSRDCGSPENRGTETRLETDSVNEETIVMTVKAFRHERHYKQCSSPQFAEAEALDKRVDISNEKISFKYRLCHLTSDDFITPGTRVSIVSAVDAEASSGDSISLTQSDIPTEAKATIIGYNSSRYLLQKNRKYLDPTYLVDLNSQLWSCRDTE